MIRDSGYISFLGMTISRTWTFGAALLIWLCWSSLLVAAQNAPTDPVEGDFPSTAGCSFLFPSKMLSTVAWQP
jgi:hypothetical protein